MPSRPPVPQTALRPTVASVGITRGTTLSTGSPFAWARARMAHASAPASATAIALPAADADIYSASSSTSTTASSTESKEHTQSTEITRPIVAYHLFALAFLVYAIVVVGGLTRLTESGLSITEWNPGFKGVQLPTTDEQWHAEWDKYKLTPEFVLLNQRMSLDDFKSIYMWEWAHRVLGRVIGVAFVLPAAYFMLRPGYVAKGMRWKLLAMGAGIGFQGALGWFMVKSGLSAPSARPGSSSSPQAQSMAEAGMAPPPVPSAVFDAHDSHSTQKDSSWTPRVSHFRLAAHLGTAFLVYLGMLHTGLSILRDWKLANNRGTVAGVPLSPSSTATSSAPRAKVVNALNDPAVRRYARSVRGLAIFVFVTAMSGALVAGLDAGMIYNEWPTMGGEGRLAPPADELLDERYRLRSSSSTQKEPGLFDWRLWTGNVFNNPTTVQLVHRTLATTTFVAVLGLAFRTRSLRLALQSQQKKTATAVAAARLPPLVPRLALLAAGVVSLQATLGITTLLYLVPIPLASAHQAGSLALLSVLVALLAAVRRPGAAVVRAMEGSPLGAAAGARWREEVRRKALGRVAMQSI
ncbi:unnamed protein product [Tilletia laevis]|uniref:Cytochrome c oxidase assembly protein COX15 n=3 Tax=Tilletia TaxID=13289 RepID=A0A8X7SY95_9BASI|nr:hypothetical protein CF336_g309 [Tilletia laevis]KAE8205661.1 hypothetical protein CF328_g372 [Tilletia controversa]KAE8265510.1 hypothetical protein A4X03_0g208 [Tilletia caries]KAE8251673.1 hypothetical protein A4X06_0g2588 [Tilletia controversa]CAD6916899.1 unnamed protein product [Tilletia laevis]